MTLLEIVVLALIQGLTEFLPISSSAHLILPSQLLGWTDKGLAFDVAVHVGTLLAVMLYFRQEVAFLWRGFCASLTAGGRGTAEAAQAWWVILATIPAAITGLLINDWLEQYGRSIGVIATTTLVFGVLLGLADRYGRQHKRLDQLGLSGALMVGLAQALALVPGTSRSGITMTAALMLGLDRQSAARFSFLLSMPIIALAGLYKGAQLVLTPQPVDWLAIGLGTVLAFASAYGCIHFFMAVIGRMGMWAFVVYRLALGGLLLMFL